MAVCAWIFLTYVRIESRSLMYQGIEIPFSLWSTEWYASYNFLVFFILLLYRYFLYAFTVHSAYNIQIYVYIYITHTSWKKLESQSRLHGTIVTDSKPKIVCLLRKRLCSRHSGETDDICCTYHFTSLYFTKPRDLISVILKLWSLRSHFLTSFTIYLDTVKCIMSHFLLDFMAHS